MQTVGANQEISARHPSVGEPREHTVGLALDRDASGATVDVGFVQSGGQFSKQVRSVNDDANRNPELPF
jgi:hypothetical protein